MRNPISHIVSEGDNHPILLGGTDLVPFKMDAILVRSVKVRLAAHVATSGPTAEAPRLGFRV